MGAFRLATGIACGRMGEVASRILPQNQKKAPLPPKEAPLWIPNGRRGGYTQQTAMNTWLR